MPGLIITGYAEADAISDRPEGVEMLKPFTANKLESMLWQICDAQTAAPLPSNQPAGSVSRARPPGSSSLPA